MFVQEMDGLEKDTLEAMIALRGVGDTAWVVARTAVGPDGSRLFADEDVPELGRHAARALRRVYDTALELSGLTQQSIRELAECVKLRSERRFYFRLALALGWPSVAWGLARISSRELTEWREFYRLEPFGEERADYRAALIAAVIANANRRKGQKPFAVKDFMPDFEGRPREPRTPEQLLSVAEMLNAALGGSDLRGRE